MSSTIIMDVNVVLSVLAVLLGSSVSVAEYYIDVPGSTVDNATSPGSLQYYLCEHGSTAVTYNSIVYLSSSFNHTILPGHFCLLAHLSNVTITSDGSNNIAHIACHNTTAPTTGFGFVNMTHLTLNNLHFSGCGGSLSSESLSSINKSKIYFPPGQTGVLVFNHCHDLTMHDVSVDGGYFGYAMIAVNVYGNVNISDVTVANSVVCTEEELKYSSIICSGSGMLFMFIEAQQFITDTTNSNHTFLNNVRLLHNTNHFTSISPLTLLQSKVPVFGAGGLTVIFSEKGYHNGQFTVESSGIFKNSGLSGGCLVVYLNTIWIPFLSFVNNCFF